MKKSKELKLLEQILDSEAFQQIINALSDGLEDAQSIQDEALCDVILQSTDIFIDLITQNVFETKNDKPVTETVCEYRLIT